MTDEGLDLRGVSVSRGRHRVLHDITARIDDGQIVAVIGPNGAGKSTLLASVAGHLKYSGQVLWDGRPVTAANAGYMPQTQDLRSALTVLEVVMLGRHEHLGWKIRDGDVSAATAVLATLGIHDLSSRLVGTLSGGQRQLVMLAQRLIRAPRLLILDEATSALDLRHQMKVLEILRAYVGRTGALVLIAIHDINLAARHADRIMVVTQGRLSAFGRRDEVLSEENLRAHFGIEAEVLRARDGNLVVLPTGPARPLLRSVA